MDTSSFWTDTARRPRFSAPQRDLTVDVAVVGAGITGVTAAYLAKKAGATVALVERDRVGGVDTACTTAHLTSVTDLRLHQLRSKFNDTVAKAVWDAGGAAIDQIYSLIAAERIACDFAWVPGFLHAAQRRPSSSVRKDLDQEAKAAEQLEVAANPLSAVPIFNTRGLAFSHQALFHPLKYLTALVRTIPGRGSHVFERSPVESVLERPLAVKTGERRIRCRYLIFATHNPLMGNTPLTSALLLQTRLSLYTSYALSAELPGSAAEPGLWWDTGDPYNYLRVERRRDRTRAIYGGEDHKTGQIADTRVPFERLAGRFRALFPRAKINHQWSGQVIETNDGLPLIGETASRQFVATGFSGNGMTFGTLGAMMAVDAMMKRKNPWQEIFSADRKKIFGGTWDYLRENKDYPYYLVRNWMATTGGDDPRSLRPGEGKVLKIGGRRMAAHRSATGHLTLCSPVCTHLQCIVDWNRVEQTWDCPCHGSRFKPTGEVISGPAEEPLERFEPPAGLKS